MFAKIMRKRLSCSDPDVMDGLKKRTTTARSRKRRQIYGNSERVAELARIAADYHLNLVQRKIASRQSLLEHDQEDKGVEPPHNMEQDEEKENGPMFHTLGTHAEIMGDSRKPVIRRTKHEVERAAPERVPFRSL